MAGKYMFALVMLGAMVASPALQAQDAPPAPGGPAEGSAGDGAAVRAPRQSWTSSRRSFEQGDVLTVLVDEHTLAAALKGANNSDRRFRDLGVTAGASVDVPITSIDADVRSTNSAESRQRGDLRRENRFRGEMSVRIMEIDPATGLLRIEGKKVIAVDKHREELELTGWARPQDVSHSNMLDSWRIADAELLYTSTGTLGKPSQSLVARVLSIFWP